MIEVHGRGMARRTLRLLKAAFRHAVGEGLLAANPASEIRISPLKKSREDDGRIEIILQSEDVTDILAAVSSLPKGRTGQRDKVLVRLLLETGVRIGEALALEWKNVDLEAGTLSIVQTISKADTLDTLEATEGRKGSKLGSPKSRAGRRTIPMSDRLKEALRLWRDEQAATCSPALTVQIHRLKRQGYSNVEIGRLVGISDVAVGKRLKSGSHSPEEDGPRFVFGTHGGAKWMLPSNFSSDTWRPLLTRADYLNDEGEPAATPHDLRHYFASVAIRAGVSLEDLAFVLGHESIDVTMKHYHHLLGDKLQRARGVIDSVSAALG
jgi:integrase